jgi:hypothetical protein
MDALPVSGAQAAWLSVSVERPGIHILMDSAFPAS